MPLFLSIRGRNVLIGVICFFRRCRRLFSGCFNLGRVGPFLTPGGVLRFKGVILCFDNTLV